MASTRKNLPNLKICIDNTEQQSDSESSASSDSSSSSSSSRSSDSSSSSSSSSDDSFHRKTNSSKRRNQQIRRQRTNIVASRAKRNTRRNYSDEDNFSLKSSSSSSSSTSSSSSSSSSSSEDDDLPPRPLSRQKRRSPIRKSISERLSHSTKIPISQRLGKINQRTRSDVIDSEDEMIIETNLSETTDRFNTIPEKSVPASSRLRQPPIQYESLEEDDWLYKDPQLSKFKIQDEFRPRVIRNNTNPGSFSMGMEDGSEEALKRREDRAKRFGIEVPEVNVAEKDIEKLYKSLHVMDCSRPGPLRLDTLHLRGVNKMNTDNVFDYFKGHKPTGVEWIDDHSCNVLFPSNQTAAKALLARSSNPNNEKEDKTMKKQDDNNKENEPVPKVEKEVESKDGDIENDELNLISDDDEKMETDDTGGGTVNSSETAEKKDGATKDADEANKMEEGECSSDDSDDSSALKVILKEQPIPLPPGQWRIAMPAEKALHLYIRFATKDDKKQEGAEGRSEYYKKHGNPNYGNMRGILTASRRARFKTEHITDPRAKARQTAMDSGDIFGTTVAGIDLPEKFGIDLSKTTKVDEKKETEINDDDLEDGECIEDLLEAELKSATAPPVSRKRHRESESVDMHTEEEEPSAERAELDQLLESTDAVERSPSPPVKRFMRMHADDEEERIQRLKTVQASKKKQQSLDAREMLMRRKQRLSRESSCEVEILSHDDLSEDESSDHTSSSVDGDYEFSRHHRTDRETTRSKGHGDLRLRLNVRRTDRNYERSRSDYESRGRERNRHEKWSEKQKLKIEFNAIDDSD